MADGVTGPLGINPLHFSAGCFLLLFIFVAYLLLPRGVRVQYFGAYPKRYAWSARSRGRRTGGNKRGGMSVSSVGGEGSIYGSSSVAGGSVIQNNQLQQQQQQQQQQRQGMMSNNNNQNTPSGTASTISASAAASDDIVVSAAMQQLRDPGVLIVAHGSRGKPKTVRLMLTETTITWRTEMRRKSPSNPNSKELKLGKLHSVLLSHIMYVDIGKQTTALRRVENASVSEALCFSLLTKEGSLDLEANSPRERDALVQCFSLVLDEVHAQNWRDIYRGPSSDMPSSFDDGDGGMGGAGMA
eukprot:CAMPEP_0113410896 /NCGR_PEP_ID=MMETSP0013_2-20120614/21958_1 /TAXON_ID=2843 ORGANISM="Skeletonema costatum, Strain 1716" /NCGR_SAMPLE_ID=MMETSP0013_2 /ASSEMBLY_ACC=CAM_ASM_000158 /LENGTH=298 /DNA_ID=CAMNT_0000297177 /DNA_START=44 /DNA_END=940 /DNA_ORIENTATION=- /assembly_acc=CAM_ASM_000158